MADKFLSMDDSTGLVKEVNPIASSSGASDAGKLAKTDGSGRFDVSLMPVGIAPEVTVCAASENLAAGDFINLWSDSGTLKARKADNSNGRAAHGFVLDAVTSGQDATVFHEGANTAVSGKTVAGRQYLGTGGATTETVPTGSVILQVLGTASSATKIIIEIAEPIQRVS